jgi:hypothetical protein
MSDKNHHNEPRHLSARDKKVIQPIHDDLQVELNSANPAADLIRKKLNTLYEDEPKAKKKLPRLMKSSTAPNTSSLCMI